MSSISLLPEAEEMMTEGRKIKHTLWQIDINKCIYGSILKYLGMKQYRKVCFYAFSLFKKQPISHANFNFYFFDDENSLGNLSSISWAKVLSWIKLDVICWSSRSFTKLVKVLQQAKKMANGKKIHICLSSATLYCAVIIWSMTPLK